MKYLENYAAYANKQGDKFWGDYAAGTLVYCKSTKRFLVTLRSVYVNEPGTIGIFGGALDDYIQNDLEETAKREFMEETGYEGYIKLIPLYKFVTPNKSFEYQNYLGLIEDEFEPELDWENEDYYWLTFDELLNKENKHFGLELLLKDTKSIEIIKKYLK